MQLMNKIVFSDVDGTLLNMKHEMTPLTVEAVNTLQGNGIPFVITSGRGPTGIYPILEEYGFNCPIIAYSGCLVLDENRKVLFHQGMSKETTKAVVEFIEEKKFDLSWNAYSIEEWIVKDKADARVINEERIVKAEAKQGTIDDFADDQINKIMCICNTEKIEEIEAELKKQFPELSIVKSSNMLIEIMRPGVNKAMGINALCKIWDVPIENTAAFGDNYNDVEMLEAVGHSFLMANAPAPLKERFTNHTKDNDHDGIYHGLKKLGWI